MFESKPTTHEPTAKPAQQNNYHGVSPAVFALSLLAVLAVGGGVAYSYMPKPPTAEEIMATLAPDESKVRKTYAELMKEGKHEDAKVYAKGVEITRAENKLPPIAFALTAVEAMRQDTPPTETATAEETTEGNAQSLPLN